MREHLNDVVVRALQRELATRRSLRPHAQLGIASSASPSEIDRAYARLRGRYETITIAEYGPDAVAAARSIAELLQQAHESMSAPGSGAGEAPPPHLGPKVRGDDTCGALETLRAAIQRRVAEAAEHHLAGRLREAARAYESVLLLDRRNEPARQALRQLHAELSPKRRNALSRMISRLFRRPVIVDVDPGVTGA